jgi:DNA-binding NarL/FixJ family response regulator
VLHPAVAARVLGQMRREEQDPLTEREKKVLQLLAAGASNKQIAAQLFISESTVKTHVAHIYEKLGVKTRAEAAVRALQLRLL